jgi:heat shock protein HtpX
MSFLRRLFYLALATGCIGLSFYIIELLLTDLGAIQLLGIRQHGVLCTGLILSWFGCLITWYIARDVAMGATMTHVLSDGEWSSHVVHLAKRAGLSEVPELGVYQNTGCNAFVVGRRKRGMLLALSQGLVDLGPGPAADLIIAHQLARIEQGDAVTQQLLQGFIAIFTLFPTRMLATFLGTSLRTGEDDTPTDGMEGFLVPLLEMLLTPYASLLLRFYARGAEARCDQRACETLGLPQLTSGFTTLLKAPVAQPYREIFVQPLKFSGEAKSVMSLLLYHQPLAQRLALLGQRNSANV